MEGMCGRFVLATDDGVFTKRFGLPSGSVGAVRARYNITPGQEVPVIVSDGTRTVVAMRWGLVPEWADSPRIGSRMINARAESVAVRPAFARAFLRRRCIVPASGFYEWQVGSDGKQPFYLSRKDGELLGFAGLWDRWSAPEHTSLTTFTIITVPANRQCAAIHERMPAIVSRQDEAVWLDSGHVDAGRVMRILVPYGEPVLSVHPVSMSVNNPENDGPELVRPL